VQKNDFMQRRELPGYRRFQKTGNTGQEFPVAAMPAPGCNPSTPFSMVWTRNPNPIHRETTATGEALLVPADPRKPVRERLLAMIENAKKWLGACDS
jgi:hypothetical protein